MTLSKQLTNCDDCGIELLGESLCNHCRRKYMANDKFTPWLPGMKEYEEAKMDDAIAQSDKYEGIDRMNPDYYDTRTRCTDCGHIGPGDVDFAETYGDRNGICHICIKR